MGRLFASLAYESLLLAAILLLGTGAFLAIASNLDPALTRPALQLWLLALTLAYFVYCWLRGGQTLAMRTWHIRLVRGTGEPLRLREALVRFVYALISAALAGLGWAWALFDAEHRFLHDRLAGTKIVFIDARSTTSSSPQA